LQEFGFPKSQEIFFLFRLDAKKKVDEKAREKGMELVLVLVSRRGRWELRRRGRVYAIGGPSDRRAVQPSTNQLLLAEQNKSALEPGAAGVSP
jgi:hypothetical protein